MRYEGQVFVVVVTITSAYKHSLQLPASILTAIRLQIAGVLQGFWVGEEGAGCVDVCLLD